MIRIRIGDRIIHVAHQRNHWIYPGKGYIRSFDVQRCKWSQITILIQIIPKEHTHRLCWEIYGYVPLKWPGSGSMIRDDLDHGRSNEPMNPLWERIHQFIWCTKIQVISDHWSWSGSSQRNTPIDSTGKATAVFLWNDPDQDQWSKMTWTMVDQMNRWIHSGQGFIGLFDLPWSEWCRITWRDCCCTMRWGAGVKVKCQIRGDG